VSVFQGNRRDRNLFILMKSFRIGIDNYGLHPLSLSPLETLHWAKEHGAQGVHFSGLEAPQQRKLDRGMLRELAHCAASDDMYLEWGGGQHIPFDTQRWRKRDIFRINRKAASEAEILGSGIVRSCSGGLMRWSEKNPSTEMLLAETAKALRAQRTMLKDHNVVLAIETHFEFTTFELRRLLEMCEAEPGDYLGICLDTMNLLTMLEEPGRGTERILPWIVSTHIKDGAILLSGDGFTTFPTRIGDGIVDFRGIAALLSRSSQEIHLSIEDHGGSFAIPVFDPLFLSKFPDLTAQEFASLVKMSLNAKEAQSRGQCVITDRDEWADICESRIAEDIRELKNILNYYREQ
jgi:sugar phosphate isomerase/epimerase